MPGEQSILVSADRVLRTPSDALERGAVLVEGDSISAVGPTAQLTAAYPHTRHVALPGATLLAGLVDAHVHLAFDTSPQLRLGLQICDEDLQALVLEHARTMVRAGVTTVRDLGDRDHIVLAARERARSMGSVVPTILAAGTPLTIRDGHCAFLGGAADDSPTRERLVDAAAAAGADVIKVMVSGGNITPEGPRTWQDQFGLDEVGQIVQRAAELGLPVAAHAHGSSAIELSVAAGVATVEHCSWHEDPAASRPVDRRAVLARMAQQGTAADPTISPRWRELARTAPDALRELFAWVFEAEAEGVRLIAGTDAGVPGSFFGGLPAGLRLYDWLGLPARRILEIATCDSADAIGAGGRCGRLTPGLRADVLAVAGDPRQDITVLERPVLVLAGGAAALLPGEV